jgi:predicted dehydrogenase
VLVSSPAGERVEHLGTRSTYTYQLEAFVASVRRGSPFRTDGDDAVATMTLIDRCYAAIGLDRRPRSPRVA